MKNLPLELEIQNLADAKAKSLIYTRPLRATSYQLIWVSEGEAIFDIDFNEVTIKAGELLVIYIGQVYRMNTNASFNGKKILFSDAFFKQTELDDNFQQVAELLNPDSPNQKVKLDIEKVEKIFSLAEAELKNEADNFQTQIVYGYLRTLLFEAERILEAGQPAVRYSLSDNLTRRFCNAVEKNFHTLKHTEFYMHMLNVCEKTLTRQLKNDIEITPKKYLIKRVVLEAKRMLASSDASVREVSIDLGFDEVTNFNKYFILHTSFTSGAFRDNHRFNS